MHPVFLYGCETWTLTKDLRRRLNSFGSRSLWRILGYRWSDFVSNERLVRETRMRFVTCIVRERQLRLYGHVARFPDADPAHQILSARESREWRRPTGRPRSSWLQQVDRHLKEMGMGQASASGIARRSPLEYFHRWRVDTAMTLPPETRANLLQLINLLQPRGMWSVHWPPPLMRHARQGNLVNRISVRKMSHIFIQPQLMLMDYAGNQSHLSLSQQPLFGQKV